MISKNASSVMLNSRNTINHEQEYIENIINASVNQILNDPASDKIQCFHVILENLSQVHTMQDTFNYPSLFRKFLEFSNYPELRGVVFEILYEFPSHCTWCLHALYMSHIAENSIKISPDIYSVKFALLCAIFSHEIKDKLEKIDYMSVCLNYINDISILELVLELNTSEAVINSIDINMIVSNIHSSFNIITKLTKLSSDFCRAIFPYLVTFLDNITEEIIASECMESLILSFNNILLDIGFNNVDQFYIHKISNICITTSNTGQYNCRLEAIYLLCAIIQKCYLGIVMTLFDDNFISFIQDILSSDIDQNIISHILLTLQVLFSKILCSSNAEFFQTLSGLYNDDLIEILEHLEDRNAQIAHNAEILKGMIITYFNKE